MLACADALSAKSVKTEILGSQTMNLSDCNAKIDTIASLMGVRPDLSVSPHVTLAYFWLKEGIGQSIRVSCSGPERKMGVALTSDPSIHRGPEAESYCLTAPPSEPDPREEAMRWAKAQCKMLEQRLEDCGNSYGLYSDHPYESLEDFASKNWEGFDNFLEEQGRLSEVFCADPTAAWQDCFVAARDSAPPPESAKTEVLGTRTMSYSDCRAKIETIASLLGVRPDYSVQSDLLTLGRFWLKEGRDESLLVTCSEPDRKMVVVLTFDPSIRRGPEAESYCQ